MPNFLRRVFTIPVILLWLVTLGVVGALGIASLITASNFGVLSFSWVSIDFPQMKQDLMDTGVGWDQAFQLAIWVFAGIPAVRVLKILFFAPDDNKSSDAKVTNPKSQNKGGTQAALLSLTGRTLTDVEYEQNRSSLLGVSRQEWKKLTEYYGVDEILIKMKGMALTNGLEGFSRLYRVVVKVPYASEFVLDSDKKLTSVVAGRNGWRILTETSEYADSYRELLGLEILRELLEVAEADNSAPVPIAVCLDKWGQRYKYISTDLESYIHKEYGIDEVAARYFINAEKLVLIFIGIPPEHYQYHVYLGLKSFWNGFNLCCTLASRTEKILGSSGYHREHGLQEDAKMWIDISDEERAVLNASPEAE